MCKDSPKLFTFISLLNTAEYSALDAFEKAFKTYGQTDGRTDRPSYTDARTHLKTYLIAWLLVNCHRHCGTAFSFWPCVVRVRVSFAIPIVPSWDISLFILISSIVRKRHLLQIFARIMDRQINRWKKRPSYRYAWTHSERICTTCIIACYFSLYYRDCPHHSTPVL